MAANVIQEFLIPLYFKVDEQTYKNFQRKIKDSTEDFKKVDETSVRAGTNLSNVLKDVAKYGAIAASTIGIFATAVIRTVDNMTDLYYSAIRAGTTVRDLMGARFGGQQIGIGADQMASAIERMSSALRMNPGLRTFFEGLGIPFSDNGVRNFENLIAKLREMDARGGGILARMIGQEFGFDEQTLTTFFHEWPAYLEGRKQEEAILRASGWNADMLAKKSVEASRNMNQFLAHWQILEIDLEAHVLPFLDRVVVFLTKAIDKMIALDRATHGWSTTIAGIFAALASVLSVKALFGWLAGLIGGGGAATGAGAAGAEGGAAVAGGPVLWTIIGIVAAATLAWWAAHNQTVQTVARKAWDVSKNFIAGFEGKVLHAYRDVAGRLAIGYGHLIKPGENFAGGITDAQAQQLLAQDTASTREWVQALVQRKLTGNQLDALTDLAYNIGTGAFARSTLLRDINAGDFTDAANEFLKWNKYRDARGNYVESPGLTQRRLGDRELFMRPDVRIDQKTDIHISGTGDPKEAGDRVANAQRRVNGDLVRNMSGAVVQ